MATNLNISENQERVPLTVGSRGVLRSITPDNGSPYYVGARAYVTQTAGGAVVTVIDKEGTTTATILNGTNGTNGQDGADGSGIADISKTGSSANVDEYTITYDDGDTEVFYITNGVDGQDGQDGQDGADGFSPIATVSKVGSTATISITDLNGTTTANISDGEVNVQSDWNQSTNTADDYIKNKPTIPSKTSDLANDSLYARGHIASFHGTCTTGAATAEKAVTCADFKATDLVAGAIIIVAFTATNSGAVASLTMNVNSTGAKPIKYINNGTLGNLSSAGYLKANTEYPFYYDGANWVVIFNVNSTYSALTEADMKAGTATTGRLITAARLKQAVQYHALVKSVNGSTGDVTVTVPTATSDLTNDGDGVSEFVTYNSMGAEGYITAADLAYPTFRATDATSKAVLSQAFGVDAEIRVPSSYTQQAQLLYDLEPRKWFCWMNGTEMEFARLSVSVNTSNSAITMYLRGRTSIATGVMGVDSSWTITPLASDAEGVAY